MNTSAKNFELNSILSDVITAVRNGASNFNGQTANRTPDAESIKHAILSTVEHEAKNSQQIETAIRLSSAGSWMPNSGVVHASLNELVESKLVSPQVDGDRRTYTITKAGKKILATAQEMPATETSSSDSADLSCEASFITSATKLGPVMLDLAQTGSSQQKKLAAQILEETRHRLHVLLAEK